MDELSGLLDGPRARGAFLLRCLLDPPWSVGLRDDAPLSVTAVVRGHAWLLPAGGEPSRLEPGDLAVLRGRAGAAYAVIADDPATPVQAVIHPGQVCRTPDGRELAEEMHQGVRSWGNAAVGETVLLTGAYAVDGEVGTRLLRALPDVVVVRADEVDGPLVDLLAVETVRDAPGQQAVLDRLLDLLLIAVLRAWFARPGTRPPGWWTAQADPVVGPPLRLMQHHPEHPWTVAGLAEVAGVSRASFARRFHEQVGQPPMGFLTQWRLELAADLLLEPGSTVASVARRVGYGSPFALSAAFTRQRGESPRQWRDRGQPGPTSTVSATASNTSHQSG
ncbi:AraC family transcriptional regulator [Nocardioides plantarum]|uniref:AraC family transcriptional regulator n=1 Tax=Nocardioides plantarum TaxID=29299 RepID=A0ABV5K6P0_9ACTN|nr:AraC family transcriptional regulator [Nocardioides plantarum]